jgi:glycosyltransferase involved in cell wall biosynthesis
MNKKIGIDARLWNETGVGRYIRNLVQQLENIDKKNTYILFVLKKDYQQIKSLVQNNQFSIRVADVRWHSISEQIQFVRILNQENLDLMHFPYFSFPLFYRKKFVITIHDLILHHYATGQASTLPQVTYYAKVFAYKFLLRNGATRAEKIITVSEATKQEIIDHLHVPEIKIKVTYEGVDHSITGHKSQIKHPQNYFLYVGNAYPHKNLQRLLEAFAQYRKQNSDVTVILVGKKDFFYQRLEQQVQHLKLEQAVLFYHNISDQELADLYQHAIACIMPSLMEGFGLPALEAMANNCLVLASDIPSLQEICQNAAVYFNPRDTDDLLVTLDSLYKNKKDFAENKKRGLERVKKFSWEKMAQETIQIYESCIGV